MAASLSHKLEKHDFVGEFLRLLESPDESAMLTYDLTLKTEMTDDVLKPALAAALNEAFGAKFQIEDVWQGPSEFRIERLDARKFKISMHHALGDGYSATRFFSRWINLALNDTTPIQLMPPTSPKLSWPSLIVEIIRASIRRWYLANIKVPFVLGPKVPSQKIVRSRLKFEVSAEKVSELKSHLKKTGNSLNDWLIACGIRTVETYRDEELRDGRKFLNSSDRISIAVPADVREWIGDPAILWNAVSGFQIDTTSADRQTDLLKTIREQKTKRSSRARMLVIYQMAAFLVKAAKAFKSDYSEVGENTWRQTCAMCISNVGRLPLFGRAVDAVESLYSAPLTLAPMGISCGVMGLNGKLCVAFDTANYTFTSEQAKSFVAHFERIVQTWPA